MASLQEYVRKLTREQLEQILRESCDNEVCDPILMLTLCDALSRFDPRTAGFLRSLPSPLPPVPPVNFKFQFVVLFKSAQLGNDYHCHSERSRTLCGEVEESVLFTLF
jgi:hypothetical protein